MQLMPFFLSSLFINIYFFPFIFTLSGSAGSLVNVLTFIHWLTDQAITFSLWCSCQACIMSRFSLLIFLRFYSGPLQQKYSTGIKLINLRSILTVRLTGHSKDLESDPTSHPSPLFRTNAGHLTTVDDFLCRVPWGKKSQNHPAPPACVCLWSFTLWPELIPTFSLTLFYSDRWRCYKSAACLNASLCDQRHS